ncbi:MAG TPA: MMPL family transporter [Burkholderiales bacterium]|nr:MMPL family transporter [Burkholderiales bacterium]
MSRAGRLAVAVWTAFSLVCIWFAARAQYTADLAAFLPRSPTPEQQLLVDQLRDGVVARVILIGIEGADEGALAALSAGLAQRLQETEFFVEVDNGSRATLASEAQFLIDNRYLLSPAVRPERFTVEGLRAALERQLDRLASPLGAAVTPILPRDATGELFEIFDALQAVGAPERRGGVWFSRDGRRALLVARTHAPGFDLDAQERAIAAIRMAFGAAKHAAGLSADAAALLIAGPGVFAAQSRAALKRDAMTVSALAGACIVALLLMAFRSLRVAGLILLPVASGVLAGLAAVSIAFGSVHGVTLGFGATLLGEAVDYAIYFFGGAATSASRREALTRVWSTLRLGVATSVAGFAALMASGFPGLAQLGLFSSTGLVVALLVTRWVLPEFSRPGAVPTLLPRLGAVLTRAGQGLARLRPALYAVTAVAIAWLALRGGELWNDELAALSPVAPQDQRLDQEMRSDLGLADVRHLIVVSATSEQAVLEGAEAVGATLDALIAEGALDGFDSPARFLPSAGTQRARLAAIPDPQVLRANLRQAAAGLPFRRGVFQPFLDELAAQKHRRPLTREDLRSTGLAMHVDSLLVERDGGWHAFLPLRAVANPGAIASGLASSGADAVLLDLKADTDALYRDYRERVIAFSLLGAAAIALLLLVVLRSARRVWRVLAPLAAAIATVSAVLSAAGSGLTVFHVVALLLVAGVGSNYTLFFDRLPQQGAAAERDAASLALCNLSTVIGFAAIGFARTPVLSAIGTTVAIGAALSLLFGLMLCSERTQGASTR